MTHLLTIIVKGHINPKSWEDFDSEWLKEHVWNSKGEPLWKLNKVKITWGRKIWNPYDKTLYFHDNEKWAHQRGAFPVTLLEVRILE